MKPLKTQTQYGCFAGKEEFVEYDENCLINIIYNSKLDIN
jgi:hypothetical protein